MATTSTEQKGKTDWTTVLATAAVTAVVTYIVTQKIQQRALGGGSDGKIKELESQLEGMD